MIIQVLCDLDPCKGSISTVAGKGNTLKRPHAKYLKVIIIIIIIIKTLFIEGNTISTILISLVALNNLEITWRFRKVSEAFLIMSDLSRSLPISYGDYRSVLDPCYVNNFDA